MKFITLAVAAIVANVEAIEVNKPGPLVSGEEGIYRKRNIRSICHHIRK